jgi:putative ABC transport system permease protein
MLISDEDFDELYGKAGVKEYLIETYFTDSSLASDYQTDYQNENLPQEGVAVTYTTIILLSAFRDIMMVMILILVSILLVMVALMCIKYTIMASLEEEVREIGTMKAIGMSFKDIRSLYLEKYNLLVAAGIIIGYVLALIVSNVFTGHVSSTFGRQPASILTFSLPVAACLLVYLIANHYCKKILKKLRKVTVVDALVTEKGFGKKEHVRDGLFKSKKMPVNLLISVRETLHNFGGYIIVFVVMLIISGIMVVLMNLLNTMQSKEFISYMGSNTDDILIEFETGENLEEKYETVKKMINEEADIEEYNEFRRVRVQTVNKEEEDMNLYIDCGNNAGKELKYLSGEAPSKENEIALSKLNADEMGKNTGDSILLKFNDIQEEFVISGIYQDVTSGGYTAKATYGFAGLDSKKYQFTINLTNGTDIKEKAAQWSDKLGRGYDVEPMEEFIHQTLGGVSRQVKVATAAVAAISILLAALIIVLFMKLRLAKDVAQIAAMKAIGFTADDVRKQYLYKIVMVSIAGIFAGSLISNTLGKSIVSMAFSMMGLGITRITFILNPWMAFLVIPLVLLAVAAGTAWIRTGQIREYNIISLINE